VIEQDFTEKPAFTETNYTSPKTCGDCGLFYKGDCTYQTGLFGSEPACEHFLDAQNMDTVDDGVPF